MEKSSKILAAIKDLQTHIGGQIQATNKTLQEFVHWMDSRFAELELKPKTFPHTNSGKFGFKTDKPKGRTAISSFQQAMKMDVPKFGSSPNNDSRELLPKLTQTSTIVDFQSVFENLRDEKGSELKCYELETKDEEVVDGISSALETKASENVAKESDCKMGMVTGCMVQTETIEEEKLKTQDVKFATDTPMTCSFVDITPINYEFVNEEKEGKRISELAHLPLLLRQEICEEINFVVEQLGLGRESKTYVARRRTTFKLYALKEVYVEFLNLHLEDKVVLKGRRVDTTPYKREILV